MLCMKLARTLHEIDGKDEASLWAGKSLATSDSASSRAPRDLGWKKSCKRACREISVRSLNGQSQFRKTAMGRLEIFIFYGKK